MNHEDAQILMASVPYKRMEQKKQQALRIHLSECSECQVDAEFDQFLETELEPLRGTSISKNVLRKVKGSKRRLPVARSSSRSSRSNQSSRSVISARRSRRANVVKTSLWNSPWVYGVASALLLTVGWFSFFSRTAPVVETSEGRRKDAPSIPGKENGAPSVPKKNKQGRHLATQTEAEKETPEPGKKLEVGEASPVLAQKGKAQHSKDTFDQKQWPLMLIPNVEEALAKAEGVEGIGKEEGRARLQPISDELSDRDTLRLVDSKVGLNLLESDLRVLNGDGVKGKAGADYLSVALGGADPSKLTFLGGRTLGDSPSKVATLDKQKIISGGRYLLKLERGARISFFFIQVADHKIGEHVDLIWKSISAEESRTVVVQAETFCQDAALVRAGKKRLDGKGEGQGEVFAKPGLKSKSNTRTKTRKIIRQSP